MPCFYIHPVLTWRLSVAAELNFRIPLTLKPRLDGFRAGTLPSGVRAQRRARVYAVLLPDPPARPAQDPFFRAYFGLCGSCTLNATGQSRVTLSLR